MVKFRFLVNFAFHEHHIETNQIRSELYFYLLKHVIDCYIYSIIQWAQHSKVILPVSACEKAHKQIWMREIIYSDFKGQGRFHPKFTSIASQRVCKAHFQFLWSS